MRFSAIIFVLMSTAAMIGAPQPAVADNTATATATGPGAVVWDTTIELRRAHDTLADVPKWQEVGQMPATKDQVIPTYPAEAKEKGLEAEVWVQALVGADGLVHRAHVTKKSAHPWAIGFEEAAIIAAMKCTYQPATVDEKPVAAWVTYPVNYKLK